MKSYKLAELDRGFAGTALADATVSIHTSLSDVESAWRRAVEHCACFVFQTFEWNSTWCETVGRTQRVSERIVHVASGDGRTLMILPLAVSRRWGLRILEFLGGPLTDYNAPLIDPAFAREIGSRDFARLWRLLLRLLPRVDAVFLARMPKTIDGARNPLTELSRTRHTDDGFAAILPATFKEFTAARNAKFFGQIRRHRRRLEKRGSIDISFPAEGDRRIEVLRISAEQKSRWLSRKGYANVFDQPATREFYERLANRPLQDGKILVACLRVGDQIVATLCGAIFGRRYYVLLPSHAEAWRKYSAVRILTESVVQRCIDQGDVRVFDLTLEEGHKHTWSDHTLALHEYVQARSLKGLAFVSYRSTRAAMRKSRRIRAFVRSLRTRTRAGVLDAALKQSGGSAIA